METLSQADLRALVDQSEAPCVSLCMPMHRANAPEVQQDPIRLKNLLRQTEERLVEQGKLKAPAIEKMLAPAWEIVEDTMFWHNRSDGLAMFISPSLFRYYRLPIELDESLIVNDRFHIRQLLRLSTGDGEFYLLALSQDEVRLLKGSRFSITDIELKDMPTNLAEALKYDDFQKETTLHGGTTQGRATRGAAVFQGHGVGPGDNTRQAHDSLLRYFREVDRGLHEMLRGSNAPLILAGVEYLFPIYREANTYPHLVPEGVTGNPELLSADELHTRAWHLIEPYFAAEIQRAAAQYKNLSGTGKASSDISDIAAAACNGKVASLFISHNDHLWGTFDPESNNVELAADNTSGADDLLDFVAIQAIRNGAVVYAVDPEAIPDDSPVAAVYRY
jgi:hypothetical protein